MRGGLQDDSNAVPEENLKTEIWVMAHIRRCSAEGIPATVARKGDLSAGTLMLKINRLEHGCLVLSQMRDMDGALGWLAAFDGDLVPESQADEYVARAVSRDPDLWVVEIEDRDGRHPFPGKIL